MHHKWLFRTKIIVVLFSSNDLGQLATLSNTLDTIDWDVISRAEEPPLNWLYAKRQRKLHFSSSLVPNATV